MWHPAMAAGGSLLRNLAADPEWGVCWDFEKQDPRGQSYSTWPSKTQTRRPPPPPAEKGGFCPKGFYPAPCAPFPGAPFAPVSGWTPAPEGWKGGKGGKGGRGGKGGNKGPKGWAPAYDMPYFGDSQQDVANQLAKGKQDVMKKGCLAAGWGGKGSSWSTVPVDQKGAAPTWYDRKGAAPTWYDGAGHKGAGASWSADTGDRKGAGKWRSAGKGAWTKGNDPDGYSWSIDEQWNGQHASTWATSGPEQSSDGHEMRSRGRKAADSGAGRGSGHSWSTDEQGGAQQVSTQGRSGADPSSDGQEGRSRGRKVQDPGAGRGGGRGAAASARGLASASEDDRKAQDSGGAAKTAPQDGAAPGVMRWQAKVADFSTDGDTSAYESSRKLARERPLRARDVEKSDVMAQINAALDEPGAALLPPDFDHGVRRALLALRHMRGSETLSAAMKSLLAYTSQKQREDVQNWPAYLLTLLKRFEASQTNEPTSQTQGGGDLDDSATRGAATQDVGPNPSKTATDSVPVVKDAMAEATKFKAEEAFFASLPDLDGKHEDLYGKICATLNGGDASSLTNPLTQKPLDCRVAVVSHVAACLRQESTSLAAHHVKGLARSWGILDDESLPDPDPRVEAANLEKLGLELLSGVLQNSSLTFNTTEEEPNAA